MWQKEIKVVDEIKIANQLTLKGDDDDNGDGDDDSSKLNEITRVLKCENGRQKVKVSKRCNERKT